jgi:hypothetical protein
MSIYLVCKSKKSYALKDKEFIDKSQHLIGNAFQFGFLFGTLIESKITISKSNGINSKPNGSLTKIPTQGSTAQKQFPSWQFSPVIDSVRLAPMKPTIKGKNINTINTSS